MRAALTPAVEGVERARPLWQRVERCWLRLAGPAVYTDADDRIDTARFLEALAAHDAPETLVGEALEELTRELYAASAPRPGAIEVHDHARGQGTRVGRGHPAGPRSTDRRPTRDPLLHWIELPRAHADTDLLLAPIRSGPSEPRNSLGRLHQASAARARRRSSACDCCMSRPRALGASCTCSARSTTRAMTRLPKPPTGSLLERLWPALGQDFLALPEPADSAAELQTGAEPPLRRLPLEWRLEAAPPAVQVQRLPLALPLLESAPEYRWVGQAARAVGTIVHAELRRLAEQPPAINARLRSLAG